jgi:hypothetical protein
VAYRTRDSVTSVVVFSTQSPKMRAQEVIAYTEVEARVMTVVERDVIDGRRDTVAEVRVAGEIVVLYEEFEYSADV